MGDKTVTLKVRDLVVWGLVVILFLWGAFQIVQIKADLKIARFVIQGQENTRDIRTLDQAVGNLDKRVTEVEKAN